jgi:hypothetical protein
MSQDPYLKEPGQVSGMGWIKKASYLLDAQFTISGTKFRF